MHRLPDFLVGVLAGFIHARGEVTDIAVTGVADGAHFVEALIHEVAEGVDVFRRLGGLRQEAVTVELGGHGHAGEGQGRRGEVDPAREVFADGTGSDLARPAHDERYASAGVLDGALVAGHAAAVVSGQDHDGVLFEVVRLDPVEHPPEGIVDGRDQLMVVRDLTADGRGVGVEGREFDLGRIAAIGRLERGGVLGVFLVGAAYLALVAYRVVDVGEERLLRLVGQLAERLLRVVDPKLLVVG